MIVQGWGRFPKFQGKTATIVDAASLRRQLNGPGRIAKGLGRSYGDSAAGNNLTLGMTHLNRFVAFDEATGQLVAEAGVSLQEIIDVFLPRGWFPKVVPGTKFVTLGGMIAANIHGKNHHHSMSFGACVDWIDVMAPDGTVQRCSHDEHNQLYRYTLGGMGLTGVILRAAIRLQRVDTGWIKKASLHSYSLEETIDLFEQHNAATYSVAWIDCISTGGNKGRSVIFTGKHVPLQELSPTERGNTFPQAAKALFSVPPKVPPLLLNKVSMRLFNRLYGALATTKSLPILQSWDSFFFPLDRVLNWNRLYGARGFTQFQCVFPITSAREGLKTLLDFVTASGEASFLSVLKKMGPDDTSDLTFAMDGFTIAMDFPINQKTPALMRECHSITRDHGGRVYLAKDAFLTADMLQDTDPRWQEFTAWRHEHGLTPALCSRQAARLLI